MDMRFQVFIMVRPIRYSLLISLADDELNNLLNKDITLTAKTGDSVTDEYLCVTLQVISETLRQIDYRGNLNEAVAMIYDVDTHDTKRDGKVEQHAAVRLFEDSTEFEMAKAEYQHQRLH